MARLIVGFSLLLSVAIPRSAVAENEASAGPTEVIALESDVSMDALEPVAFESVALEPVSIGSDVLAVSAVVVAFDIDVPELIIDASHRYGLDPERMLRVAWCESRWNPNAIGPGGASGVFQFMWYTWAWASVDAGYVGASPFNPVANIEVASWLMATQGPRHWTCR